MGIKILKSGERKILYLPLNMRKQGSLISFLSKHYLDNGFSNGEVTSLLEDADIIILTRNNKLALNFLTAMDIASNEFWAFMDDVKENFHEYLIKKR